MIAPPWTRVLAPAALTFLAGGLLGFAAGRRSAPAPPQGLGPHLEAWYRATVVALDLDEEQAADLRILLRHYARLARDAAQAARPPLPPEPDELDRLAEGWLHYLRLSPEQLARLQELTAPAALLSAPSAPRYPGAPWPEPSD